MKYKTIRCCDECGGELEWFSPTEEYYCNECGCWYKEKE
jgi:anaerobic ribonucleoside-triphosphate reductase